jgi:transposase
LTKAVKRAKNEAMSITPEQFERIKSSLPVERGNVSIQQLNFLNAILYVLEHGCKWRRLPREYGNWHNPVHAAESLEQGGRAGAGVGTLATRTDYRGADDRAVLGQHHGESAL